MLPSLFKICCRRLVDELRRAQASDGDETFFLGFDEEGSLFYKVGNRLGGQMMSVCTEPLTFCPFCGGRVGDGEAGAAGRIADAAAAEEATVLALEATREIETVLALVAGARGSGSAAAADL
jgi:hypothetical protein